jgi:hypothetical protein
MKLLQCIIGIFGIPTLFNVFISLPISIWTKSIITRTEILNLKIITVLIK